jgi:two-component system sensor histidine kinase HydH
MPIYLRVEVLVEAPSIRAGVRQARIGQYVSFGAAAVLVLVSVLLFLADRRAARMRSTMERQRSLAEMGEMAAVLAHEIRNPLGVIKGTAQVLLEQRQNGAQAQRPAGGDTKEKGASLPDPVETQRLSLLVDQSGRLEKLVGGLLDYARPAPLERRELQAVELAEQAVQLVSTQAVAQKVALVQDFEKCSIYADKEKILQVLLNVLRNALEASPNSTTVTFRVHCSAGRVVFSVTDSGPGLDPELGDQIYRPFVTTKTDGTGLGLSISRRIVEAHGGTLEARNVQGRGACFVISIPRRLLDRPTGG